MAAPLPSDLVASAARRCAAQGESLTPLRRRVLELLLDQHGPAKAYDLLDALKREHPSAKPPTIYRALDFLVKMGLAHRVESLNAFLACGHDHEHAAAIVLLCERCGRAEEAAAAAAALTVAAAAQAAGFTVRRTIIEAAGVCGACRE